MSCLMNRLCLIYKIILLCSRSGPGECASHTEYGSASKPLLVWVTSTRTSKSSLNTEYFSPQSTQDSLSLCLQGCVCGGAESLSVPAGAADAGRRLGGGL